MKLSIITVSHRPRGRLAELARCLQASAERIADVNVEWLLHVPHDVDQEKYAALRAATERATEALDGRFNLIEIPPGAPALEHAHVRNSVLSVATGDYVLLLEDCTVVTSQFVQTAVAIALEGKAWRCKSFVLPDLAVPDSGIVKFRDHWDRLRPVPATSAGAPCWGAPRAAFDEVGGFDPHFDGELAHNDVECAMRIARTGRAFVTTDRAIAIRLRRTQTDIAPPEAYLGKRNTGLLRDLVADRLRTSHWEGPPEPVAAPAPPPSAPAAPAPRPPIAPSPAHRPPVIVAPPMIPAPIPKPPRKTRETLQPKRPAPKPPRLVKVQAQPAPAPPAVKPTRPVPKPRRDLRAGRGPGRGPSRPSGMAPGDLLLGANAGGAALEDFEDVQPVNVPDEIGHDETAPVSIEEATTLVGEDPPAAAPESTPTPFDAFDDDAEADEYGAL